VETFLQDLRYGARMLLKNPRITFVVVITAALGIGVNTAIFCLVDAALLRPLPIAKAPEELVVIRRVQGSFSYPDFKDLREGSEALSGLALHLGTQISFGNRERSEVVRGSLVCANYFEVLGIKPVLGRTFLPEEDETPGAHPVVVLSHNFWQSRFNGDRSVIGRNIVLNNRRFTVVGVAAAGFNGEEPLMKVNFWAPVMMASSLVRVPDNFAGGISPFGTRSLLLRSRSSAKSWRAVYGPRSKTPARRSANACASVRRIRSPVKWSA
jgi:putative ABC transport system permease protein